MKRVVLQYERAREVSAKTNVGPEDAFPMSGWHVAAFHECPDHGWGIIFVHRQPGNEISGPEFDCLTGSLNRLWADFCRSMQ